MLENQGVISSGLADQLLSLFERHDIPNYVEMERMVNVLKQTMPKEMLNAKHVTLLTGLAVERIWHILCILDAKLSNHMIQEMKDAAGDDIQYHRALNHRIQEDRLSTTEASELNKRYNIELKASYESVGLMVPGEQEFF